MTIVPLCALRLRVGGGTLRVVMEPTFPAQADPAQVKPEVAAGIYWQLTEFTMPTVQRLTDCLTSTEPYTQYHCQWVDGWPELGPSEWPLPLPEDLRALAESSCETGARRHR